MVGEFGIGIISKIVIPEAPTKQIHTHIYMRVITLMATARCKIQSGKENESKFMI